jgi:hypothetical protein
LKNKVAVAEKFIAAHLVNTTNFHCYYNYVKKKNAYMAACVRLAMVLLLVLVVLILAYVYVYDRDRNHLVARFTWLKVLCTFLTQD